MNPSNSGVSSRSPLVCRAESGYGACKDYLDRITCNPAQCGGRPCIRVKDVLDLLAADVPEAEILADFPDLETGDIKACLQYAAAQADHAILVGACSLWSMRSSHTRLAPEKPWQMPRAVDDVEHADGIPGDPVKHEVVAKASYRHIRTSRRLGFSRGKKDTTFRLTGEQGQRRVHCVEHAFRRRSIIPQDKRVDRWNSKSDAFR